MVIKYTVLLSFVLLAGCGTSGSAGSADPGAGVGPGKVVVTDADAAPSTGGSTTEGPQGPAGPQGPTGATGPAGAQGAQGPKGDPGAAGLAGATGAQGEQGPAGPVGPQGIAGVQGQQGVPGATGATGPAGTSIVTRSNVYMVTGTTTIIPAVTTELVSVQCNKGPNDILLAGGCVWSPNGLALVAFGADLGSTTYDATYTCEVHNPGGSGLPAYATATCLRVP